MLISGHSALWHAIKLNQTGIRKLFERALQQADAAYGNLLTTHYQF
jgi:hypothetical protein